MTLPLTEQDIERLAGQGVRSLSPQDFNHLLAQAKLAIELTRDIERGADSTAAKLAETYEIARQAKEIDE